MSARHTTRLLTSNLRPATRLAQLTSHFRFRGLYTEGQRRKMATNTEIPKTMKGVVIEKTGGVDVLEYRIDLPVPVPKEGEVLVKNEFIGINYIDTYFRTGLYPSKMPLVLGREAEGHIVSLGPGSSTLYHNLTPGSRVVFMGTSSYAEYTAAPALYTHVLPSALPPGIGAAAILQGLTALTLIREAYLVQKGDWVLVHASAGGVGLWLCQLLRVVGARTIGTASTEEKLKLAKENGAEVVINYKTEKDLVKRVKEITGGEGVKAVFDSTGKDQFENDLEVVARKGTVISYGNSSGPVPPLSISRLAAKNIKVLRPTLFNYIATREEYETYAKGLFDFILKDKLNVRIHDTYPLEDIRKAHTDIEGRGTTGKLLLKP